MPSIGGQKPGFLRKYLLQPADSEKPGFFVGVRKSCLIGQIRC